MVNVFISWSGEKSRRVGEEIRNWIPSVLQFAKPYYTPSDIEKGAKWSTEISKKLADCDVGIICLTPENLDKPWILFEAGALSKNIENSKVCSILLGVNNTDLVGPLTTFQTTRFEKDDFKKLMETINTAASSARLTPDVFSRVFDKWWPDLETKISEIISSKTDEDTKEIRSDREILEEILKISRTLTARSIERGIPGYIPEKLINDQLDIFEVIFSSLPTKNDNAVLAALSEFLKMNKFLARRSMLGNEEYDQRVNKLLEDLNDYIPF